MCGIVASTGRRNVVPVLLEGLKRLEYRGYDSCGVAVWNQGLKRARSVSRVSELAQQVQQESLEGFLGIAHTRWATHGAPAVCNAHPHFAGDEIALVHNGIIENYEELRAELMAKGVVFSGQTDSEVLAYLVREHYHGDLLEAVKAALKRVRGAYAIAVFAKNEPERLVVARLGSPLVLGVGEHEMFAASDTIALAGETEQFIYLEDGDVADLTPDSCRLYSHQGEDFLAIEREVRTVRAFSNSVELGPYRHYMQKEIFEQPRAIGDTLEGVAEITPSIFGEQAESVFSSIDRILIIACGTSYYAGLTAKYWLEGIAKIPTDVEIASEYRYRSSVPNPNTLVITISQSGETADTIAALKHARSLGMDKTLTICNVATSAMVRESLLHYITHAGVEIGVASTKAFTTQLVALFILTLTLAKLKERLSAEQEAEYLKSLRHTPQAVSRVLALEPQVMAWADRFVMKNNALFLGRGIHYPIALEGALKLKEISYIHAEAYPAGELKHGPLALVDESIPVVTVAPNDELFEKLKSNMKEVEARKGELYVFADADTGLQATEHIHVIRMPENYGALSPILHVITLQLLAYYTALARGNDVDKPRNLAKSVTVE